MRFYFYLKRIDYDQIRVNLFNAQEIYISLKQVWKQIGGNKLSALLKNTSHNTNWEWNVT